MKRFRVRLRARAEAQLDKIDRWWRRNRREHPDLVVEEFLDATRELAAAPEAGEAHETRRIHGVRRLLLPRSRYWLYYQIDWGLGEVQVLAIWHTSRDKGPPLK